MKLAFAIIIALQMLFLVGQTAMYQSRLSGGETVYLKVAPYDPRSLFMGNYANLSFDISQVSLGLFEASERGGVNPGDTVYVGLSKDRPAKIVRASLRKPTEAGGLVWLKGRVDRVGIEVSMGVRSQRSTANVTYGLERFYLSESKGKKMDDLSRRLWDPRTAPTIIAVASVGKGGAAMLKDVLVDGKSVR